MYKRLEILLVEGSLGIRKARRKLGKPGSSASKKYLKDKYKFFDKEFMQPELMDAPRNSHLVTNVYKRFKSKLAGKKHA